MLVPKVRCCNVQQYHCKKAQISFHPFTQTVLGRKNPPAAGAGAAQEQNMGQKESSYPVCMG